ncbi:TetR/AcrR family transcriptional regulator [Streptomyces sp. uw30]|uniref:TetR/AcrR family transcriptional regulator n=1 Tax=Streptomyces sp. uw30 TaxID=1828179 RepID=UPI003967CA84
MGSLYHHFGSIDGLTLALSHRWLSRLLGDGITALQGADTAKDGVRALVRAYLAFIQEHPHAADRGQEAQPRRGGLVRRAGPPSAAVGRAEGGGERSGEAAGTAETETEAGAQARTEAEAEAQARAEAQAEAQEEQQRSRRMARGIGGHRARPLPHALLAGHLRGEGR